MADKLKPHTYERREVLALAGTGVIAVAGMRTVFWLQPVADICPNEGIGICWRTSPNGMDRPCSTE